MCPSVCVCVCLFLCLSVTVYVAVQTPSGETGLTPRHLQLSFGDQLQAKVPFDVYAADGAEQDRHIVWAPLIDKRNKEKMRTYTKAELVGMNIFNPNALIKVVERPPQFKKWSSGAHSLCADFCWCIYSSTYFLCVQTHLLSHSVCISYVPAFDTVPIGRLHLKRVDGSEDRRDDGRGIDDTIFHAKPQPTIASTVRETKVCGRGTLGCPGKDGGGVRTAHDPDCKPIPADILAQKQHVRSNELAQVSDDIAENLRPVGVADGAYENFLRREYISCKDTGRESSLDALGATTTSTLRRFFKGEPVAHLARKPAKLAKPAKPAKRANQDELDEQKKKSSMPGIA